MSEDLKAMLRAMGFTALLAWCSTTQADDRPLWPRWGVVLYAAGYPIRIELAPSGQILTESECRAAANMKNASAARAGIRPRWKCEDLAQWGREAQA